MSGAFDFLASKLTLTSAAALSPEDWAPLSVADLDVTPGELAQAADLWLWLTGVESDAPDADRVRREVLTDAPLLCALALPAVEFLRWFRGEDWEAFDSTERTGSEAWAMGVMQRAWAACEALGSMAVQCPIGGRR